MARERPPGGGSRSATHPAYQTALGEGRGREAQPQMDPEPGLCSPTPALPSQTQRDGASAGLGGTERHPQRERDRDGAKGRGRCGREVGSSPERGNRLEQGQERRREDGRPERVSQRQTGSETQGETDRDQSRGGRPELERPGKEQWVQERLHKVN